MRRGSGGAGEHRGGDGVIRELEALAPMRYSLLTERRRHAPPGADGRRARRARAQPARRRGARRRRRPESCARAAAAHRDARRGRLRRTEVTRMTNRFDPATGFEKVRFAGQL